MWVQREIALSARPRGYHLLGIADAQRERQPDVRRDFAAWFDRAVPDGRLVLGTRQGIYLCEHRDHGGPRSLLATIWGESAQPSG